MPTVNLRRRPTAPDLVELQNQEPHQGLPPPPFVAHFLEDSSAIVKRYVQESGTGWVQRPAHPGAGNLVYLARITGVEVNSAIARRRRSGSIPSQDAAASLARFQLDLDQEYLVLEITPPLLADAMRLANAHELRAYDAVQLAAALELNGRWLAAGINGIILVSADRELDAAGAAEGLQIEDPNLYP